MKIGYTTGVFDLFHIGHVNVLRNARAMCDKLVVGVTTDELVAYKGKSPVITFAERIEVIRACRYVDVAVPQESLDKFEAWKRLRFDMMFVGDDWFQNDRWRHLDAQFAEVGVKIIYFPYTKGTSSTLVCAALNRLEGVA